MVVMKFGGSSVATAAAIARVRAIVEAERRPRVVVVSALGGVTDALLAIAARAASRDERSALDALRALREHHASIAAIVRGEVERRALLAHLDAEWLEVETLVRARSLVEAGSPAVSDAIVAHGELASSRLLAAVLNDAGLPAEWLDARSVIVTDERHQHASPLVGDTADRLTRTVGPLIATGTIPVLGGFIGATTDGVTSTLGRGGSDFSASLIGACLGAEEIQIWTDVDGMLTADPHLVRRARPIGSLSFEEASALARFGAKVLHPATVRPARETGIPLRILNSRRPSSRGTLVTGGRVLRRAPVAGIASMQNLSVFEVPLPDGADREAALATVFDACARAEATVHLTAVAHTTASVVVDDGQVSDRVAARLASQPGVTRRRGLALVAVVGDGLERGQGIAWRVLAACDAVPVHLLSRAPGSNHLALVVDGADLAFAVAALHEFLVERQTQGRTGDGEPHARRALPSAPRDAQQEARA